MTQRCWDLHQTVLDLQPEKAAGETAVDDWFRLDGAVSTLRICLEDPQHQALAAALIVQDGFLNLADGTTARLDERLLAVGGVDIDGRDGAPAAAQLCLPRLPRGAQTALAAAKADPSICAAARLSLNGDAAVTLVGVAPYPVRARQLEALLRGRRLEERLFDLAAQTARAEAQPYGSGDLTAPAAVQHAADAVRRLCHRLRDRLEAGQPTPSARDARRRPARRW